MTHENQLFSIVVPVLNEEDSIEKIFSILSDKGPLIVPMVLLGGVLYWWVDLAIMIKRLHDHDKSGWWWVLVYVPVVGYLWAFIYLGCMKGTDGPNGYGDAPV